MPNGCQKCWEEFKGWLKAFTPVEIFLTIIEALLLILLLVFLIFLVIHLLTCHGVVDESTTDRAIVSDITTVAPKNVTKKSTSSSKKSRPTCTYTKEQKSNLTTPSANETDATSPYSTAAPRYTTPTHPDQIVPITSDGELADESEKLHVMALVKIKPSGVTFGCILTVVAERWVVTAASCLDSIEEVDSLDNFVIMDNYGALNKGRSHPVSDVRVHPLYNGGNKTYDLALLQSEDGLGRPPVQLASLLDYFKLPIGEAGSILGFGRFRTIDQSVPQQVHSAVVHILPYSHCDSPEYRERHLIPLAPVAHGRCGASPLCLGVLHARGAPCNYCAGAPLMRAGKLLGVMADNEQCGAACEPALYANVAAERQWLHASLS
ncbi:trypsin-like [Leguminivora glycinivorella]|uniref:trypsin-like n=1 Tax=Leguminivora glycinivorella TaxID=1035111 RepID=UPI0020100C34|nr:trypsin-like [Leguminivora glycinivorella]